MISLNKFYFAEANPKLSKCKETPALWQKQYKVPLEYFQGDFL